jgi:alpha-1,3-glucosyltransferase
MPAGSPGPAGGISTAATGPATADVELPADAALALAAVAVALAEPAVAAAAATFVALADAPAAAVGTAALLAAAVALVAAGFAAAAAVADPAAAAVAAIARGAHITGSVLYTLSFNHKQMSLFYAPAFFAHLLGRCLAARRPALEVARLGATGIGTMLLLWAPFLREPGPLAVAVRLAPIGRGVFEDFVASLWCVDYACLQLFVLC